MSMLQIELMGNSYTSFILYTSYNYFDKFERKMYNTTLCPF